jgi:hypothetical protein
MTEWIEVAQKITLFWDVAPRTLVESYHVSEKSAASTFRIAD